MRNDDDTHTVTLTVNGTDYAGWKSIRISAGIERQARDFSFSVTRSWTKGHSASEVMTLGKMIHPGDVCTVRIGNDLVLTGFVDATPINYDATQISISVNGRSKTADLIDCSVSNQPGQWRHAKLEAIAQDMASVYGIQVVAQVDTGAAIREHQIQQGETVFESIERLLRNKYILATDNALGELVLIDVGTEVAHTALVLGENIKQADTSLDYKDRFSEYLCKGQNGSVDDALGDSSACMARLLDHNVARRRTLIIKQSGQVDEASCQDRVEYERASRAARTLETHYTVQGWRQSNGALWQPNMRVHVRDPVIGFDTTMLIVAVEYRLDEQGTVALLKVGPVGGYAVKTVAKKSTPTKITKASWRDAPIIAPFLR